MSVNGVLTGGLKRSSDVKVLSDVNEGKLYLKIRKSSSAGFHLSYLT